MTTVFPRTPEALSLAWLNQLPELPGRPFAALSLSPLGEDTGFYGQLVKITATPSNPGKSPVHFVAKFAAASPEVRLSLGDGGYYRNEYGFYRYLAPIFPVSVPRAWFTAYDEASHETLLLLDWVRGEFGDNVRGANWTQAQNAIDALRVFHRAFENPRLQAEQPWIHAMPETGLYRSITSFDGSSIDTRHPLIDGRFPGWLMDRVTDSGGIMRAQLDATAALPRTLAHCDYRMANLCFAPDGQSITIIDWQFLCWHTGLWDLCAFLFWSMPTQMRRNKGTELVLRYLETPSIPDHVIATLRHVATFLVFNLLRSAPLFNPQRTEQRALFDALLERSLAAAYDCDVRRLLAST